MIGEIKSVAAAACGTLMITGIFMMLVPSAAQQKVLRLSVSLFFLLSLAAPLIGSAPQWQENAALWEERGEAATDFRSLTQEQLIRTFRQQLESQARDILREEGITPLDIRFSIHTGEDGRISITSLEILLDQRDGDRCGRAIARLNQAFGLTTVLSLSESEGGED